MDRDIAQLTEQYARQTARWNEIKARFAALPPGERLRVPTTLLEELASVGADARRIRPLPPCGVKV
ncbi:MAG TPA: hypothetical protein VEK07_04605 [Polyangiaceae bacterium]|nr:hypothetical protein [Polyangiaceae bacterium]